jgi:uncharacterized protein YbaR (Trm112 family)
MHICPYCQKPIKDTEASEHTEDGLAHTKCLCAPSAAKREAAFYREQLELICKDHRRTRARRLAESALTFWDSLKAEAAKRKKARAAND